MRQHIPGWTYMKALWVEFVCVWYEFANLNVGENPDFIWKNGMDRTLIYICNKA